ncbi:hypothetical protein [Micromonospora costi]|uniref:Uncharacterized protein n=1 Tax=Micromonospora costi TaxID=1530042 RepID=A0A3A9ZUF9_9ACTN|nr:hypothetical protein [Micromonospora costi]RKN51783.1 hypothetical protein D7193_28090 [Micromonospora costi]
MPPEPAVLDQPTDPGRPRDTVPTAGAAPPGEPLPADVRPPAVTEPADGSTSPDPAADPGTAQLAGRSRRALWWLIPALAAAWLLPLAAQALHATAALPPLVLLATAGLLRAGRSLFDRILLAVVLLLGVTAAAGLLFTVWPWKLQPVPVTGLALTVLALMAAATGRRPALPRPSWTDAVPLALTAVVVRYLATPYVEATDAAQRVAVLMRGEDNLRHLALVDVIGRIGGYPFVDAAAVREHLLSQLVYYPQGWHLSVALLDGFLVPPAAGPRGLAGVDHYAGWTLAGFGLLTLALYWAAQWLPLRLHPLHRVLTAVLVGSLLLGTQLPRLLTSGYPTEALGMTLTVVLGALVARPVNRRRDQLVLLGTLLVGIAFTYYLFLVPAALLVAGWLLVARGRALRGVAGTATVVALCTAALVPVVPLAGLLLADQSEALAATNGPDTTEARLALLGLGGVVALALILAGTLRTGRVWRRYLWVVLTGAAYAVAIAHLTIAESGEAGYYFNKSMHLATALFVVGTAAVVGLVPGAGRRSGRGALATVVYAARAVASTVLVVVTGVTALTATGLVDRNRSLLLAEDVSWAERWVAPDLSDRPRTARTCVDAYRRYPPVPDAVTVVVDQSAGRSYRASICLSSLQGTTAQTEPAIYELSLREPDRTVEILRRITGPVRLVVADPVAGRRIDRLLRREPQLRSRVTTVPAVVAY